MTVLDPTIPTRSYKTYRLVGEQSNAWWILLHNDRKSRHRRIKRQRRYERLAATSQFLDTILLLVISYQSLRILRIRAG